MHLKLKPKNLLETKTYIPFTICNSYYITAQTSVYYDPNYPKPSSGYGADGSHTVGVVSFSNPYYPSQNINIYYPSDIVGKVPTIFYSHAYGGYNPVGVDGMLYFVARKGYAIVFVPYQTTGVTVLNRYANLLNGFQLAARNYPNIIDTTEVGFMGWSFGGGASFANAYTCFTQYNWGQNGRFIYALAQWYSYNISQAQLQSFPSNVKLLTEIFDNDSTNDHRMAVDIFNNVNIATTEKDFVRLISDTIGSYIYDAKHNTPATSGTSTQFNAFDYYGYYRLLDALCDYTFNGSLSGKNVALGHGDSLQVTMPVGLRNLVEYISPAVLYPQSKYQYPCTDSLNLRASYCPSLSTSTNELNDVHSGLRIYPNPATSGITLEVSAGMEPKNFIIINSIGQLMPVKLVQSQSIYNMDVSAFPNGIYFIQSGSIRTKFVKE